ncbi:MAG: cyclic nucleotide-binding domain-containing protein [Spirochaetota bacterium]|nr:cyclic nucleotide-binding domain-containing protein [Spirochaetota bacterium]
MNFRRTALNILSIRRDELGFVIPLFALYFLSGSFFAIGQIFSETIFLKEYGAEGLSRFFIYNGAAIITAGICYNYFLLKMSLKKAYIFLIGFSTIMILLASVYLQGNYSWLPFYMYMGNYLFTFFLDMHFFNFAFQFLNLRSSKRILPFLMGGAKLGGILISLIVFTLFSESISEYGIYIWAINAFLLFIPFLLLRFSKGISKEHARISRFELLPDYTVFEKIFRRFKITYSSPIFLYSAIAVFMMSIANQISEFYFSRIFNNIFHTKNELAAFLSMYTFITDFITLFIQFFIVSGVIDRIGVRNSNLVYPISFLSLISLFIAFPNIIIGILIRFWRKNLSVIIRTPIYNTIIAASPRDRIAEFKSFISGIISPIGMIIGGGIILLISEGFSIYEGYVLTLSIGALYLLFTYCQNRAYIKSLRKRLSFDTIEGDEEYPKFDDYSNLLSDPIWVEENLETIEFLFNRELALNMLPLLNRHFDRLSTHTKEGIINLLDAERHDLTMPIISKALQDEEPFIRGRALYLLTELGYEERERLLRHRYHKTLKSEEYAISILLSKHGMISDDRDLDSFCIESVMEIKEGILQGEMESIEFVIIIQVLPHLYFLNHLVDIALATGNIQFLKSLIPFSNKLSACELKKIFHVYRDAEINYLINLSMLAGKISEADKTILLDYRKDISQDQMGRLFKYDETTAVRIVGRLFQEEDCARLSNYLNYMMSMNHRPRDTIDTFIDFEINRIIKLVELIDSIKGIRGDALSNPMIPKFLCNCIEDIIEFHKHLILKAIAILTGTNIEEAYESILFLKDRDLDNCLLEYIETSGRQTKKALSIFVEGERIHQKIDIFLNDESIKSLNHLTENFTNEILDILNFSLFILFQDVSLRNIKTNPFESIDINSKEGIEMLSLIEKITFLKENALFSGLQINELIHISNITQEIEVPKDRVIIKQGEIGDELFIILEGEVEVYTRDRVLSRLNSGSCIGELSIIDKEPRSASVKTMEKTRFLSIKRNDFLLTLKENPTISINIMQLITHRLRSVL